MTFAEEPAEFAESTTATAIVDFIPAMRLGLEFEAKLSAMPARLHSGEIGPGAFAALFVCCQDKAEGRCLLLASPTELI